MRLVNINNLEAGMIVGRPILDDEGRILLNGGKELSATYIKALGEKGFESIYISDNVDGVLVEGDDDLNTSTRSKAISALHRAFELIENHVSRLRERSFDDISKAITSDEVKSLTSKGGPFDEINISANEIMGEILSRTTLAGLTSIKSVVTEFMRLVPVFPQGTEVLVRSSEHRNFTGIVSSVNRIQLDRPTIILFRDNQKNMITPIEIDLAERTDILIRGIFN